MEQILNAELEACCDIDSILNSVQQVISSARLSVDPLFENLIDIELFEDIRKTTVTTSILFGSTLRDIKCIYIDGDLREHAIFIRYLGKSRLVISSVELPFSSLLQEREYQNLQELIKSVEEYLEYLSNYLYELDHIDRFCTVVEPVRPTFKNGYRKIKLGDRVWLHVEVSQEGQATNMFLIGQCGEWQDVLQKGLLNWDHDLDIVENVTQLFDLIQFPELSNKPHENGQVEKPTIQKEPLEQLMCTICLCPELSETFGQPQPLCQNDMCRAYFHRHCLFQWLVSSSGGRPPAFSVATGSCPACFKNIACSERN